MIKGGRKVVNTITVSGVYLATHDARGPPQLRENQTHLAARCMARPTIKARRPPFQEISKQSDYLTQLCNVLIRMKMIKAGARDGTLAADLIPMALISGVVGTAANIGGALAVKSQERLVLQTAQQLQLAGLSGNHAGRGLWRPRARYEHGSRIV